ncbi:hypothetical protein B0H14DRAFT_3496520 [Mycena olivaceomarginata]|nr:hypothetical protein B0H14DRAFT_3496520 [Mycena olivaceomarginata]
MAHNIPNNQGYAGPYAQTVAFLLGLAPSPSSTNREFAVARINAALTAAFSMGHHRLNKTPGPTRTALTTGSAHAVTTQPAEDFFSHVHAHMNVNPETATLGRKESVEPRKTPYHRLSSPDDLEAAISHLVELQNSWRRKRAGYHGGR